MFRRLFQAASASAPAEPVPPASVGVAKPPKIEPSTTKISAAGGRKLRSTMRHISPLVFGPMVDIERRRKMRLGERQDALVDEIQRRRAQVPE